MSSVFFIFFIPVSVHLVSLIDPLKCSPHPSHAVLRGRAVWLLSTFTQLFDTPFIEVICEVLEVYVYMYCLLSEMSRMDISRALCIRDSSSSSSVISTFLRFVHTVQHATNQYISNAYINGLRRPVPALWTPLIPFQLDFRAVRHWP
jgi:hypothetical protein